MHKFHLQYKVNQMFLYAQNNNNNNKNKIIISQSIAINHNKLFSLQQIDQLFICSGSL